jgi:large subunit ribosomal protein L23
MALFWQKGNKETPAAGKPEKVSKKPTAKTSKPAVVKTPKTKALVEKKADKKAGESQSDKRSAAVSGGVVFPKGSAIIKPRVTEKAGRLAESGVYTFEVLKTANSKQIADAIQAAYKVTPVKISVAPIKSKAMFVRGKSGKTVSGKKAYVYLKEDDKIEFI